MSEWKPISEFNAEKHKFSGEKFLFYTGVRTVVGSCSYSKNSKNAIFVSFDADDHSYDSWNGDDYGEIKPTHWMELPEPPK